MEHKKLKKIKGFLSIISAAIIVIVSLTTVLLLNMFSGSIKSTQNISESNSAFYLALSALQIAKRDIIVNEKTCDYINNKNRSLYRNVNLNYQKEGDDTKNTLRGKHNVRCYVNRARGELKEDLTERNIGRRIELTSLFTAHGRLEEELDDDPDSHVILKSTAGFDKNGGVIKIDKELIAYEKIEDDNELTNPLRGVQGTTIAPHKKRTHVSQGFLDYGFIIIEKEALKYIGIDIDTDLGESISSYSGVRYQSLLDIKRGVLDTLIKETNDEDGVIYKAGTKVTQNMCILVAEAGIPDLDEPTGKRRIEETLATDLKKIGTIDNTFPLKGYEHIKPALVSKQEIELYEDSVIKNPYAKDLSTSTILARMFVTIKKDPIYNYNPHTEIEDGVIASNQNNKKEDIVEKKKNIDFDDLFYKMFLLKRKEIIKNKDLEKYIDIDAGETPLEEVLTNKKYNNKIVKINGQTFNDKKEIISIQTNTRPKILIIDGNLILSEGKQNIEIGTPQKPIKLIIKGNLELNDAESTLKIYGTTYISGHVKNYDRYAKNKIADLEGSLQSLVQKEFREGISLEKSRGIAKKAIEDLKEEMKEKKNKLYVKGFLVAGDTILKDHSTIELDPMVIENDSAPYKTPYEIREIFE